MSALALGMVDTRTGYRHLVAVEVVPLHRRSGRYSALCGTVDILDLCTGTIHLLTSAAAAGTHRAGRYVVPCGADIIRADDPGSLLSEGSD